MKAANTWRIIPLLILLLAMAATPVLAGDPPAKENCDRNETISIEVEDDDFIVTTRCGDSEKVVQVNLDAVEGLVAEAVGEVTAALEDMEDMQLQIHLGQDNRLSFADDGTEWEIDLSQVARQIEVALEAGFAGLEDAEWSSRRVREEVDMDELRRELAHLQREMEKLQKELQDSADER